MDASARDGLPRSVSAKNISRAIRKATDKMAIRVGRAWLDGQCVAAAQQRRNEDRDTAGKGIVQTLARSTPHARQIHRISPSLNESGR